MLFKAAGRLGGIGWFSRVAGSADVRIPGGLGLDLGYRDQVFPRPMSLD